MLNSRAVQLQSLRDTIVACATARGEGSVEIEGDREHPANFGRLCSKGSALGETLSLEGRLLTPIINKQQSSWDIALDLVARDEQAAPKEIESALGEIHANISAHFALEEQLMSEAGFEEYTEHKNDHEELLDQIKREREPGSDDSGDGD